MRASDFISRLGKHKAAKELSKVEKFFKGNDGETKAFGVSFGTIFKLAKEFQDLPLKEINKLLDSKYYEVRMGAVSMMDYMARNKKISSARRKELFNLYIKRHDRLNNWDFVDRAAPSVVGTFLKDKTRDILYKLARSRDVWKRRTAMVSTYAFIREGQVDDTFRIAEILVYDKHELINKAVGSWVRTAGLKHKGKLLDFLDAYAATMPRVTLRYAIEKLDKKTQDHYRSLAVPTKSVFSVSGGRVSPAKVQ
jgi:3-methyladenine DNA glycosylase AlkD